MNRLKRDASAKSFLFSPLALGVLGLFSLVLLVNVFRVYGVMRRVNAERNQLTQEIQAREQEISDLHGKIKSLESGEGMELEARARLNLQKPDEKVLIVLDNDGKSKTATSTIEETWFDRLKKWLGFGIL